MEQIQEEFLLCPICNGYYKEPKLLPCLHTFCLKCIEQRVKDNIDKEPVQNDANSALVSTVTFICPVCKIETELGLSQDMQIIVTGFSDNHLIANLLEKIHIQNAEQVCESCRSRKSIDHTAAKAKVWCQDCKVSFCDNCIKAHDFIKACRDHVVISLGEMQMNPLQIFSNTKRDIPCSNHDDKILEFYCTDCHVAVCSKCVAVQHRRCETVETCANTAEKLKLESESFLRDFDKQGISLTAWQQEHVDEIEELEETKEMLVKKIRSFRKAVDTHLASLETTSLEEIEVKSAQSIEKVKERLEEIEALKKKLENTNRFLRHLLQYGSDCEFISMFDKVKQQIIEMNININKRKISKLVFRHKFSLDGTLKRVFDLKSLGKIVDVVDMKNDGFNVNGENGVGAPYAVRKTSIKRTGTFRVDRAAEDQQQQQSQQQQQQYSQSQKQLDLTKQLEPQELQINSPISITSSRSSLSTRSASTSSDSMSSQEVLDTTAPKRKAATLCRQQQEACARLSSGSTGFLLRPKRVSSSVEFRQTPTNVNADEKTDAKTLLIHRRAASTINGRPPLGDTPIRPDRRSKTPEFKMVKSSGKRQPVSISSTPAEKRTEIAVKKSSLQSKPAALVEKTNAKLLCSFNGRTENDSKKCWPLDVTVLVDGTPVITDFHNKKIKAFDTMGTVTCDLLLPSWPHGITHIEKNNVAVTLPEISTLALITVNERCMILQKKTKTAKQYRGICCLNDDTNKPVIIVSCCAPQNQSVDGLTLEGEILFSHREDNRQPGRNLFTWPYYVAVNTEGDIVVSDCETKIGLLHLSKNGNVKHDYLSINVLIQDPRGICTDLDGNVYIADKSAHVIHSFTSDGHYRKCVVSAVENLQQPIAVCVSPFGHIIVTQDNGDIKVYAIS